MCEFGKYGQNCSETCGKCFENTCNHINGTCADGCAAGFMTNLCKTSMLQNEFISCQYACHPTQHDLQPVQIFIKLNIANISFWKKKLVAYWMYS